MSLISKQVPVIRSDAEALSVARELAAHFKRESAVRDRERRLPFDELELFSHTGLWGITVPKALGGAGVAAGRVQLGQHRGAHPRTCLDGRPHPGTAGSDVSRSEGHA